jgi:dipeptidyl aminopeptidase/acylaminoacyl peptidase
MTRTSRFPARRVATRALITLVAVAAGAVPAVVRAQSVAQQGWNPQQVLSSETYMKPPAVVERIVSAPRNNVVFTNPSPDHRYFLQRQADGLPTIDAFGKPHYRIGGVEIDSKANRARSITTRGSVGLTLIDAATGKLTRLQTPAGALVTDPTWSPDGKLIGYLANFDAASYLYVVDPATGRSTQVSRTPLLAVRDTVFDWTSDGSSIVAVFLPADRGAEPKAPAVATGPLVRTSEGRVLKNRNYASLMHDQHDKDLLDYYSRGQLAVVNVKTHALRNVGAPALILAVDASPDAQYFRVTLQEKPYSYIVPVSNFGTVEQLWDANGKVIAELSHRALREGTGADSGNGGARGGAGAAADTAKRNLDWNPVGAGIVYVRAIAAARGEGRREASGAADSSSGAAAAGTGRAARNGAGRGAARRDEVMLWLPPFRESDAKSLYQAPGRIDNFAFGADGAMLFVDDGSEVYAVNPAAPARRFPIARGANLATGRRGRGGFGGRGATADSTFYNDPGDLRTVPAGNGEAVVALSGDRKSVFLTGTQHFHDWTRQAPRAFVDRVDIETGAKTRLFEADSTASESVVEALDPDMTRLIVTHETPSTPSDVYLRDIKTGSSTQLTHNVDYAPEVTHAIRKRLTAVRPRDGYKFYIDVTLPSDYKEGTRLPGIIWFYPTEFSTQDEYDQRLRTTDVNRFPNTGPRAPEIWVTQGYVVIQPLDIPIVGPEGRMNDHYVDELREDMDLTLETVEKAGYLDRERVGLWGHSYGAFSTANAMVHTPYFRAGIAGDGMYNRTLTPYSFQNERRDFWQAQDTYLEMSPFMYADRLHGALLMYHSMEDQNVGTDPISSIRMMQALEGQGKIAALYMYPYEDHGPATRESDLDQWARWIAWFDKYVKPAQPDTTKPGAVVP